MRYWTLLKYVLAYRCIRITYSLFFSFLSSLRWFCLTFSLRCSRCRAHRPSQQQHSLVCVKEASHYLCQNLRLWAFVPLCLAQTGVSWWDAWAVCSCSVWIDYTPLCLTLTNMTSGRNPSLAARYLLFSSHLLSKTLDLSVLAHQSGLFLFPPCCNGAHGSGAWNACLWMWSSLRGPLQFSLLSCVWFTKIPISNWMKLTSRNLSFVIFNMVSHLEILRSTVAAA